MKPVSASKMDKLMQDLDFIDQPLAPKRIRKQKTSDLELNLVLSKKESCSEKSDSLEDEEKRRRKNKEQVQQLQKEYVKNTNWTRAFMKELAKMTGLKASQVYKWNWDQKKKEANERKMKSLYYPNEIFQVVDQNGINISKPVF